MRRLLVIGFLVVCGCADANNVATVAGTVTMDGKPLAGVRVRFEPDGTNQNPGAASYAVTDSQGRYTLQQIDPDRSGAVVGSHIVRITTIFDSTGDGGRERVDPIPPRYNNRSELRFDVPSSGANSADFALTSR